MEIGSSLGHYTISAHLGSGGMGDVYRAEDTRLRRDVAIKVLPAALAADQERLARMEREAQVLAALDHPNIAAIYGLEEAEGVRFLVMQLAEGATLADRIASGPIPLEEALPIGLAITEALEAAHASGIVHRDLKPANVQIGADGKVTLLDFGLAKVYENTGNSDSSLTMAESPTIVQATQAGVILGTAPYMSPEQARGQQVDTRSDIWAFGCVMYEMLSGGGAFSGPTVTDVLGSIVHKDPDWDGLPRRTPRRIRMVMLRCLRKDPVRRLQAIGDARIAIQEYLEDPRSVEAILEAPAAVTGWQRFLPWGVAAAASLAALGLVFSGGSSEDPEPALAVNIALDAERLFQGLGTSLVLTDDGDKLVYAVETGDGAMALRVRSLSTGSIDELYRGPNAYHPFLSPDSRWVGFSAGEELQKVPLSGGSPISIAAVERNRGASWGADGNIVYAPSPMSGLLVVSDNGGEPRALTELADGELTHRWPQVLPDGRVLFTTHGATTDFDGASLELLDPATGDRKVVLRGGYYGRYVPGGFLTYVSDGSLFAATFDLESGEVVGSQVPVISNLTSNNSDGGAQIDVSRSGRVIYHTGGGMEPVFPSLWVDQNGQQRPLWEEPRTYAEPRVSPDGTKVSYMALADNNWDVWVHDLQRDVSTRVTFDPELDGPGIWSADGKWIAFSSLRGGQGSNLFRKLADGAGEAEQLTQLAGGDGFITDWSSRDQLIFTYQSNLWSHDIESGESQPYLESDFVTQEGAFSPDGNWVAYASDESGRIEIYVRPFPSGGGKWQVSAGGGNYPRWTSDGERLIYRTADGLMAADVEMGSGGFRAGRPTALVTGSFRGGAGGMIVGGLTVADWAAHPSGERFVMFPPDENAGSGAALVTLETQWFQKVQDRLGGNR